MDDNLTGLPEDWKTGPHREYYLTQEEFAMSARLMQQETRGEPSEQEEKELCVEKQEESTGERQFADLPPMRFENFIGQKRHVDRVKWAIMASEKLKKPLPHMAFIGPAGTGKTSLASCCANSVEGKALYTTGIALSSMEVVADIVNQVGGGIVFIDEAHALVAGDGVVAGLLPLLEDWKLSLSSGAKNVKPFTCIMATTNWGVLDDALISRMGEPYELDSYNEAEMALIALEHAKRLEIPLERGDAGLIAMRSRRNPRDCRVLLVECYHAAIAGGAAEVTAKACHQAFDTLKRDRWGLKERDRKLLRLLKDKPVAKSRCAGRLGMDLVTFEKIVYPFLFAEEYITTATRGVELTDKGKLFVEEI